MMSTRRKGCNRWTRMIPFHQIMSACLALALLVGVTKEAFAATTSADCQQTAAVGLTEDGTFTLPVGVLVHSLTDKESKQTMEAVQLAIDEVNRNATLHQRTGAIKWKLVASVRPTNWQRFDALEDSLSLIETSHAIAIVGMAASTTVSVVGPVAGRAGVPAIATAVTNRDTHTTSFYPTFLRACPSDVLLPFALKDLVLHYIWHSVALIYSTAFSGYHAVNDIIDKAPGFGVNVVQSVHVEFDGTSFDSVTGQKTNLSSQTLDKMASIVAKNCKIIVLNVDGSELLSILQYAKKLGMLEKGYAWIVLQFFTSPDLLPQELLDLLDGALVFRPKLDHVQASALAASLHQRSPAYAPTSGVNSLSLESVYSYDAVQSIGLAIPDWIRATGAPRLVNCGEVVQVVPGALSLRPWQNISLLVTALRNLPTRTGAGGPMKLGDDYSTVDYDVFNLVNGKLDMVGDWTSSNKLNFSSVDFLERNIRWTGGTYEVPSTRGFLNQNLRIYVPLSNPFTFLLRKPPLRNEDFSGVAVDILRMLANSTGFNYTFTLWNGSWTDMVRTVGNESTPYDLAIGSITVNAARAKLCSFSQSIFLSGLRILVNRPQPTKEGGFWSFFLPFHWTVWVVLVLVLIFSGFVLTVLDPAGVETQRHKSIAIDGIFFSFMSFFFVHEADEIKMAWARIYLVVVQFCMLVMVTLYTANMATFLAGQSAASDITDYADLYQKPVGCRNGTSNWAYVNDKLGLRQVVAVGGPDEALECLRNGSIVAYIADSPHISRIAAKNCDVIVLGAHVDSQQYAFAFKKNSPWQLEIDRALGLLINQGKVTALFNRYVPTQCQPYSPTEGVKPMTLSNLGGLFILLAIGTAVATVLKLYSVFYVRRKKMAKHDTSQWWSNSYAGESTAHLGPESSWAPMSNDGSASTMKEPLLELQKPDCGKPSCRDGSVEADGGYAPVPTMRKQSSATQGGPEQDTPL